MTSHNKTVDVLLSNKGRIIRAKMNIIVSLFKQIVILLCGIIVPKMLISAYGSEAYGATTSIAQFLAYVTLLEGGIGGVARAALYKPLAENDKNTVGAIVYEIKQFFRKIGAIFFVYVLILACGFKTLAQVQCFDWFTTFLLVLAISISTFAQYFIGISYAVLLQAAQLSYITDIINIVTTILNTILIIGMVHINSDLVMVKLVSSCIFVLRPVFMYIFAHRKLGIKTNLKGNKIYLKQKWNGLAQHIAYFLHTNTDIAVLTIFSNLTIVAVYSVYNMIVSHIQNISSSFSTGMEALFGDMLARNEIAVLHKTFDYYDMLISYITTIVFSITMVMIIPFIKIYTFGIDDVNYIEPLFSIVLIFAAILACLRMPYQNITIAAGHFKQTQIAAYGEAIINITLSIILVIRYGLIGVAIGTLVATAFRMIYYAIYLSKHIFYRPIYKFIKREAINIAIILLTCLLCNNIQSILSINNYFDWALCAVIVALIALVISSIINYIFYRDKFIDIFGKIALRHKRR